MARVRIGTASWTDRSLLDSGKYYPEHVKTPADRLRFYSAEFPLVEVDSSYYAMPSQRNSELWVERTPDDFIFNVKAFRLMTNHPTQLKALPRGLREELPVSLTEKRNVYYKDIPPELRVDMWKMFADALLPLDSAGKLGVVVFQFPPWFMPRHESRDHILECQERLPQYCMAVEFRNQYWLNEKNRERTLQFLKDNRLAFVAVDEPQGFKSSVPPVAEVTTDTAMVRFHGRNTETWEKKGLAASSERFNYTYSKEEMQEWVPRVQAMAERAQEMHLIMNTNYGDQGIINSHTLADLLGQGTRDAD